MTNVINAASARAGDHMQKSAPTNEQPGIALLRISVADIDALAQSGFSRISAVAKMALACLESPTHARDLDVLAEAFIMIDAVAQDIQNCINTEAENVGCNYVDKAKMRRWDAARAIRTGSMD